MPQFKVLKHILLCGMILLLVGDYKFFNHKSPEQLGFSPSPQLIPLDSEYAQQATVFNSIELPSAWDIVTGSQEVIIAVIDDAIDIRHPDLRDNMMPGWDFVDGDSDPSPGSCIDPASQSEIAETHGTSVAGVIGAVGNNNQGGSGVNWQVKIMPLRIGCHYRASYEAQAVAYAIAHGAQIINASYGGPDLIVRNQDVFEQLSAAPHILFVTSAGNYHINNDDTPMYPANLGLTNVVSVAAVDLNGRLTEWAQYGPASVDLAAPGTGIFTLTPTFSSSGSYRTIDGSSFSSAIVSGVAGLMVNFDLLDGIRDFSAAELKGVLQASVRPLSSNSGVLKTDGIVNARQAIQLMSSPSPVVTVVGVDYDDSAGAYPNGVPDRNETGALLITLENLWDAMLIGNVSLTSLSASLNLTTQNFTLSTMAPNTRTTIQVPVSFADVAGYQSFRVKLQVSATGTARTSNYIREFAFGNAELENQVPLAEVIQKNDQDDYRYYHLNLTPGNERVAIELEYPTSDTRDMGLLAEINRKPNIHFRSFNNAAYWYYATSLSDTKDGYERIDIRVPANANSTLHVLLFNTPSKNLGAGFQSNKSFTLKACNYSDTDGNRPPAVNAGSDMLVQAGETVRLQGEVSDSDGQIGKILWKGPSEIPFTYSDGVQAQFIAPSSGEYTFFLSATDDGCKKSVDSVTVTVDEDNTQSSGLMLIPNLIEIEEGTSISNPVSATFEGNTVQNLVLSSAPEGLVYDEQGDEFNNTRISWQNAGPAGTYYVTFTTNVNNQSISATLTIKISERGSNQSGGGCTLRSNQQFDPVFYLLVMISLLQLKKNNRKFPRIHQFKT